MQIRKTLIIKAGNREHKEPTTADTKLTIQKKKKPPTVGALTNKENPQTNYITKNATNGGNPN